MAARSLLGFGMTLAAAVAACSSEPASTPPPILRAAGPVSSETGLAPRASALGMQGLQSILGERGAVITPRGDASWRFAPSPTRFGCDGALVPLASPTRGRDARRVAYARPELDEWYAETPRGLEQGFSIPTPPPCRRAGGHGVVIELGGGLRAVLSADGRAAHLHDASGSEVLRYTDLHVRDAKGRELPAKLEADGTKLAIRFDDTSAAYPVEVDPLIWGERQGLLPSVDQAGDTFGASVALSGDTVVVGAPGANGQTGQVYAFVRSGAAWQQQWSVGGGGLIGFGAAVAVSGDSALVGAPAESSGAAYFYARSGTVWTPATLVDPPSPVKNGAFGTRVALDGDTALVTSGLLGASSAIYVRSGNGWILQQELPSLSGDAGPATIVPGSAALSGDTAIIGAPFDANMQGAAYVYVRSGTTWSLQQELTAPNGMVGDAFGLSAALDGDTAIVGAPNVEGVQGAAYVFTRNGGTWTVAQELPGPGAPADAFARSVALSGNVAMIGALAAKASSGEVFVYLLSGGTWTAQQTLVPTAQDPEDEFGAALALQGTRMIAGAPGASPALHGTAYVFDLASSPGDPCTTGDACVSGFCVDGVCCTTASCPAMGDCNAAETCQAGTGTCSHTGINEGMACDAGACMGDGTCHAGACVPQPPVCAPPDDCHDFGTCDPSTNACVNPAKPDGQPCANGTCVGGVCQAESPDAGSGGGSGGSTSPSKGCACALDRAPGDGSIPAMLAALLLVARRRRARRAVAR